MKKCMQCGALLGDEAKFCTTCGSVVEGAEASASEESNGTTSAAEEDASSKEENDSCPIEQAEQVNSAGEQNANQTVPDALPQALSAWQQPQDRYSAGAATASAQGQSILAKIKRLPKPALGGGAVAVVALAIVIGVFAGNAGKVPVSEIEAQLASTKSISGMPSDRYLNESDYETSDINITSQSDEKIPILGTVHDMKKVTYEAKTKNANYDVSLQGEAYFSKSDNSWVCEHNECEVSSVTPLKGVDRIDDAAFFSSSDNDSVESKDFSASFEGDDGSYISTATDSVTYDYWFATDTAKRTQTFKFDGDSWEAQDSDPVFSDEKTEWKIAGKTLVNADKDACSVVNGAGTFEGSMKFGEIAQDGSVSVDCSMKNSPEEGYKKLSLSGTASGKVDHEFGSDSFSAEFNDKENELTYRINKTTENTTPGAGTRDAVSVDLETNIEYESYLFSSRNFGLSGADYVLDDQV